MTARKKCAHDIAASSAMRFVALLLGLAAAGFAMAPAAVQARTTESQSRVTAAASSHSFDLLTDTDGDDDADGSDNGLSASEAATLKELKKIGSSIPRQKSSLKVLDLAAGQSGSGASSLGAAAAAVAVAASGVSEAKERGVFIPFGKSVPAMPGVKHYTATGHQECKACQQLIRTMYLTGPMFPDLTWGLPPEYKEMGKAQQAVLQACPEFMNDWCYEDLGGTQMLRSPCPAYLTCHYCLGLNPLHCLPEDDDDEVTFR